MLGGAHLIISNGLINNLTKIPISAFILGIISHHICDRVPHMDFSSNYNNYKFKNLPLKTKFFISFEFLIGVLFLYFFFYKLYKADLLILIATSFGAIFPDIITILFGNYLKPNKFILKYMEFHRKFHSENKNIIFNIISEILLMVFSIWFFINSKNF